MALESKFHKDKDLAFLQYADWQDLKTLAEALIKDHSGTEQWTGQLKKALVQNIRMYKTSEEDAYKNSWMAIAAELQLFGGDTIMNLARRKGTLYKNVAHDVAKKIGLDFNKEFTDVAKLEEKILLLLFGRVTKLNDMPFIYQTLEQKGLLGLTSLKSEPWNTVKNGAGLSGNAGAAAAVFAGIKVFPKLGFASLPLMAKDFSAPAYRVTIPAVCIVAMMRTKYINNSAMYDEF